MSRDCYETVVALPDATGAMKALSGIKVTVVPRGAQDVANSAVDIFASDTGATRGPDPKTGATGTNPLTTTASGAVRFWAEGPTEYDIVFEDTQAPARIADRVGWNAIPAKLGSIPTTMLAGDKGITLSMLADEVTRQDVPIGAVIEWWRPSNSGVPYPDGFELCDGHVVNSHDFKFVTGPITTPDLQNVFILGAVVGKADGGGTTNSNTAAGGPGINYKAGSNLTKNLTHTHTVPGRDHTHSAGTLYTGGHSHSVSVSGSGSGSGTTGGAQGDIGTASGTAYTRPGQSHQHGFSVAVSFSGSGGTNTVGNLGVGGSTGAIDGGPGSSTTDPTPSWTDPTASGAAVDFRPQFVGLLRLIKCRKA